MHLRLFSTLLILLLSLGSNAQTYKYNRFSEKDGLKNRFIYTISQDDNGYLLIGSGEGLFLYNGFVFKEINESQGLSHNFITCSTTDNEGNVWLGHDNGTISIYQHGRISSINLDSLGQSRINQIITRDNKVWVVTQHDGVLFRDANKQWHRLYRGIEDYSLYSIFVDKNNRIWLGTDIGLIICNPENDSLIHQEVDELFGTKVSCILAEGNQLIVGTEDLGIFILNTLEKMPQPVSLMYQGKDFSDLNINNIYRNENGDLWICTNNKGVIQLSTFVNGEFHKLKSHASTKVGNFSSIKSCFADREGNIWIGTLGDGLIKIQDSYLTLFDSPQSTSDKITSIYEHNDTIWTARKGAIQIYYQMPDSIIGTITTKDGLPEDNLSSLKGDMYGNLWIGTDAHGIFIWNRNTNRVKPLKFPGDMELLRVNDILHDHNTTYVATNYGVYQIKDNQLVAHITIQSGLSSNSIKAIYKDVKGNIWFATTTGQISYIERGELKNITCGVENGITEIRCITEDNEGRIWIGTDGMGVICLTSDSTLVIDKKNGIYSDFCYSITCDQRNNLWVGHQGALSKINLITGRIDVFDPSNALDTDFLPNAVCKTNTGSILFGTSNGIVQYQPENDRRSEVEPQLHFEYIYINDSLLNHFSDLKLDYGKYNIRFDFIGISLKNAAGVNYQFYLEGYDSDWQPLTALSEVNYNKLEPGNYVFRVKCFNSDGFGGNTILQIAITIDKPFWQKWWFIALCALSGLLIVRYIIFQRERLLIENQNRLQEALDQRTKEVVEQKELLEIKNKDITDSIIYAKNIQQAMLPSENQLQQHFPDSFLLFKPRDIVSGDFYWTEQYGDYIVVACADCTGHGVPGAFMSLIGSTLLKDVAGLEAVKTSADILSYLDQQLKDVLHKRGANVSISDGMDISVMDYNVRTQVLRVASANRPVFLIQNQQLIEIKGDRDSIGGDSTHSKEFTVHEFQISKGDSVYMFSDGITDQFGGELEKKLKKSGLRTWIEQIKDKSMKHQSVIIAQNFNQWKGQAPQTDDVILLGVRF